MFLADEMGTGKTVQAACALELLRTRGQLRRALVVVPASLKLNWYRELEEWAPGCTVRLLQGKKEERQFGYHLPVHVLIASYEQIQADFAINPPSRKFDVVILDEAQRVKNWRNSTEIAVRWRWQRSCGNDTVWINRCLNVIYLGLLVLCKVILAILFVTRS